MQNHKLYKSVSMVGPQTHHEKNVFNTVTIKSQTLMIYMGSFKGSQIHKCIPVVVKVKDFH